MTFLVELSLYILDTGTTSSWHLRKSALFSNIYFLSFKKISQFLDCLRLRMLGSIDANTGSPDLGWDTDQFPMDIRSCTAVMKTVLEQVFHFIPRGHCLGPRRITTELFYV